MMTKQHDNEMSALVADHSERLFADLSTPALLAAVDAGEWCPAEWQQVAMSGFLDALVAPDKGGPGLETADAFGLVRRAAFHALPLPIGETMVARAIWSAAGGELQDIGEPWTLASAAAKDCPRLESISGQLHVRGTLQRLAWGRQCEAVIAQARNADGQPCLLKLKLEPVTSGRSESLANEPRDSVRLAAQIEMDAVLPMDRAASTPLPRVAGALVRAHQMVGAMQRCLALSLQYASERVQFGAPIGKFPAVQMMLVEAAGQVAAAGAAADLAASQWNASPAQVEFLVAVAKSRAGEAAGKVAALCHQVHGAIGFTQEHVLHYYTRRLWSWRDEFGGESWWNRRVGDIACSQGADALWPALTQL
jgi:acyl-CoA dehydrogenase